MIRIYTTDNVELDLNPDTEFEIEICNPMFEPEHLAAPFSTSIAFPLSPGNIYAFKCLVAFKNIPEVRELVVEIYEDTVFIASGTLVFEGINEDGELEYQFIGEEIPDGDYGLKKYINAKRSGKYHPRLSIKDYTGIPEYEKDEDGGDNLVQTGKFFYGYEPTRGAEPLSCMHIKKIIEYLGIADGTNGSIEDILGSSSVLPFDNEMTIREFIQNVCRLFCLAVFRMPGQDGGIEIKSIDAILGQSDFLDLSDRVSDAFSSVMESGKGYRLAYANDRKVAKYNPDFENNVTSRIWGTFETLEEGMGIFRELVSTNQYRVLRITQPEARDYSIKSVMVPTPNNGNLSSIIYRSSILSDFLGYLEDQETDTMENGEQFDSSVAFNLVECNIVDDIVDNDHYYRITPLVSSSGNTGVLVGNLYTDLVEQLTDGDVAGIRNRGFTKFAEPMSIKNIYERLHARFAEWLYKDKQVVDVDVDLTAQEIANYKIWEKVMFDNAFWIAKKLTVTMSVRTGISGCRGEFIAL